MKNIGAYLFIVIIVAATMSACVAKNGYEYKAIIDEYSDTVCALNPAEKAAKDGKPCSLNRSVSLEDALKIAISNDMGRIKGRAALRVLNKNKKLKVAPYCLPE